MTRKGEPSPGALDDGTVDFASEILHTPPSELRERISRLSPEMQSTVLAEVVRRYQSLHRQKAEAEKDVENLRYHTKRLEEMILRARKTD
ncbi:MAG: hypothetical protein ACYTFG_22455 [Planctomycetota bacterium]